MKANGKWQPKIEHDVPVPLEHQPVPPFNGILRQMKPKDSLYVPAKHKSPEVLSVVCAQVFGKGNWAMRKEREGHRVWRLK